MRTLYVRIIIITMAIVILSAFIAFIATNVYYHYNLKPGNDKKVTEIAKRTVAKLEEGTDEEAKDYLTLLTEYGYQFYLVDKDGSGQSFGKALRTYDYSPEQLSTVLNGSIYHGIAEYPWGLFVTGFFNSDLKNTVGIPVQINDDTKALFMRANTVQQFGEMRFFLAVLLVFSLLVSFLFILLSTRFIVSPIKKLTDATKRIAAGNYHLKLNVNRSDEIGRLAHNFIKMSNELKQIEEKRQQFVSNVSHEIQSPLTSIQGFSQALREEDLGEEDRSRYLSIIEKESRRLSILSNQLLTLSFLDSEIDNDSKVSFDLQNQLKEVISTMEWEWREKELAIELICEPINVVGDPQLLHQIWMNLFTNAIHYTNSGGTITIETSEKNKEIQITFKDTGVGIAKEDIPQLFERFYIIDKARTRTITSTGLGLSIVKRIVELHHGTIMVESELGIGTSFIVTLPKK